MEKSSTTKSVTQKAYDETLKKIYSSKPKENFLLIEFDYTKSLLLPYDEGLKLLSCFKSAELYEERYSQPKRILPFNSETFKTRTLSRQEYEDIKIAALLGVTVEELLERNAEPIPF